MHSHDSADVAGQITPAGRAGQVLAGVQAVRVDHEVSVAHVDLWRFRFVLVVEVFGQGALLDLVDAGVVEPGSVGRHNYVVCLFASFLLEAGQAVGG